MKINWEEFKEYKQHNKGKDNFYILLNFIRSYYNMHSPIDIYDILVMDELAKMMLEKREIIDAEGLEDYLYKQHS